MFGAVWSQAETRKVLGASGARVIDTDLSVGHADQAFSDDGWLADIELRDRYVEILDELVAWPSRSASRPRQRGTEVAA